MRKLLNFVKISLIFFVELPNDGQETIVIFFIIYLLYIRSGILFWSYIRVVVWCPLHSARPVFVHKCPLEYRAISK
jgi:hypothetical protein